MIPLPEFLLPFQHEAERLVAGHLFGSLEFSSSTYQVEVLDAQKREEAWAFLQLDEDGQLKDRFCSCEVKEEVSACKHLAAAYLRIMGPQGIPLHKRFRKSLWNRLGLLCAEQIEEVDEHFCGIDKQGRLLFSAKGRTAHGEAKLREIFLERPEETEQTSLKFSNLTEEEIALWRQGRPNPRLRYVLSCWYDLAKWLMLMQDAGTRYTVAFEDTPAGIPSGVDIQFPDVALHCELSERDLSKIFRSLDTVETPLKILWRPEDSIRRLTYDKEAGEFAVERQDPPDEAVGGIPVGSWWLVAGKGVYSRKEHPLLRGMNPGEALAEHRALIRSKLEGAPLHEEHVEVHYNITFDPDWNLHIRAHLFEPGDLQQPYSRILGDWAYLHPRGFFRLKGAAFKEGELVVPCEEVAAFIHEHRAWLTRQEGFSIHLAGVEAELHYTLTEGDTLVFTQTTALDEEPARAKDFGPWIYVKGQGFFVKVSAPPEAAVRGGVRIAADQIPLFLRMYHDELQLVPGFFSPKSPVASMGLRIEVTEEETISIAPEYTLYPDYVGREFKVFDDHTYVPGEGFHKIPPERLLPVRFRYPMELEKESFPRFFLYEMEQLKAYATYLDPRLAEPKQLQLVAETLALHPDGYRLNLRYTDEAATISFAKIWGAIRRKGRFLFSDVGLIDLTEERFAWIAKIDKNQFNIEMNLLTLSTVDLLRLNTFDPLIVKEGKGLLDELLQFRSPVEPDITALKSHLRPYQELGLKWLWFLYHHRLSGLLCDDMGLGKTHQAMALMAAIRHHAKEKKHFLVVCPTSVIYHWEEKLHEFLPGVRVCTFHGSNRSLEDFHHEYDILLTSYGIWRNENALLSEVAFEVAIFDEIQAAKNQKSRLHASMLKVKAGMRLGLTGTPIENRLLELKALFDIILPNFMPSEAEYKTFFVNPIEREKNVKRGELLTKYIKPFVLRRRKEEVLFDLPEKTEEIIHCELSEDQRRLYREVLRCAREGIARELQDQSAPIPYLHIFSALSSLKQICNHPAAYLKNPLSYPDYRSGKWDLFVELLNEALESNQKVVVFSQYLRMLDIIEQYLHENEIGYATIRGATVDRGAQVRRFNQDPSCLVFIGSLQAAGLGIDLTAGSVVIHYDRWWNAAREDQATDRVHRIGQTRGVQVFKLVTKGTFEERIDEMIFQKGKLMEDVVGVDDHRFMKHFDREEILQLLKDL